MTTLVRRRRSSARVFGEVVGHVRSLHELFDNGRVAVRFRPARGTIRSARADRTLFFKRRIRQGHYEVNCLAVFGGMVNGFHAGTMRIGPGLTLAIVDGSGGSVHGRVRGVPPTCFGEGDLELREVANPAAKHTAMLDRHGRFFFCGLRARDYVLEGHVPGKGIVPKRRVSLGTNEDRVLDDVQLVPQPYIRFKLRTPEGRQLRGAWEIQLWSADGRGAEVYEGRSYRTGGRRELAVRNKFQGRYCYRAERRGFYPVEGRLSLERNDLEVPVVCRRVP